MKLTIQFELTVERHEPSGAFLAPCPEFPGKSGYGLTEEEAVAHLRARMPAAPLRPLPTPPTTVPWYLSARPLPDDEFSAEWKRIIQERRDVYEDTEPERG